ncbi:MAG: hypothetical protein COW89_09015 [Nitrospinae bacterium CG22_combo_CG10-13_8_21_14_all_47_10]|nr:MAG: hypothetical protein COW89_09015 [Nitrospinae bacterium CG22_combo_CG10-13_8_21_14_all_47_10]
MPGRVAFAEPGLVSGKRRRINVTKFGNIFRNCGGAGHSTSHHSKEIVLTLIECWHFKVLFQSPNLCFLPQTSFRKLEKKPRPEYLKIIEIPQN